MQYCLDGGVSGVEGLALGQSCFGWWLPEDPITKSAKSRRPYSALKPLSTSNPRPKTETLNP